MSLMFNCESAIIDTTEKEASLSVTLRGRQIMNFHTVSGSGTDYKHPLATAQATYTNMASGSSTDHMAFGGSTNTDINMASSGSTDH
ncbi:hypothetical protein STEG23_008957 [Scotinomys teguina]